MVFKCLVKIKLSLGTSSAATTTTTTPTKTTSLERSLLSLLRLRLRRGGQPFSLLPPKPKVSTLIAFCLVCPPRKANRDLVMDHSRSGPATLLCCCSSPLHLPLPPAARQRSYGQSRCLSNIYPGIACACANTNKISVNFFKLTHTHAHSHTHLLLFICLASCLSLALSLSLCVVVVAAHLSVMDLLA